MKKLTKGRKTKQPVCKGGPFAGLCLYLFSGGTMSFRVPSFDKRAGHYDRDGIWSFDE